MINANKPFAISNGGEVSFGSTVDVVSVPTANLPADRHIVDVRLMLGDAQVGSISFEFDAAKLATKTGTGASPSEEYYNQIEQLTVGRLNDFTYNTSNAVTFTIT